MDIWQRTDQALKKANVPISIIWSLTHRCNLNCCHCYNVKDASELAWPQVRRIGAQLRKAGCLFITLTGGEVFIRRDFFKIAALLRRLGFDIRIITNGTLVTGAMAQELKKISPSEIGVSVLGATAATHDRITGVRGSFDKTLNAITLMKEQQLPVHMRSTILKENFQEYRSIIKLAKRLGIHFLLDPVVSPKDDGSRDVLSHRLDCSQMERFFRERTGSLVASPEEEKRSHCEAGRTFGAISARGEIYPCIQLPVSVGDATKADFRRLWAKAPLLKKMRQTEPQDIARCADCRLAAHCHSCPGLAFLEDGDAFAPSSTACLIAGLCEGLARPPRSAS